MLLSLLLFFSTRPLHVALYNRNDDLAKVIANSFYCDCDRAVYLKDMRRVHNPMEDEPPCTCRAPPLLVNVTNDYGYTRAHTEKGTMNIKR
jgi:hypothetical protein